MQFPKFTVFFGITAVVLAHAAEPVRDLFEYKNPQLSLETTSILVNEWASPGVGGAATVTTSAGDTKYVIPIEMRNQFTPQVRAELMESRRAGIVELFEQETRKQDEFFALSKSVADMGSQFSDILLSSAVTLGTSTVPGVASSLIFGTSAKLIGSPISAAFQRNADQMNAQYVHGQSQMIGRFADSYFGQALLDGIESDAATKNSSFSDTIKLLAQTKASFGDLLNDPHFQAALALKSPDERLSFYNSVLKATVRADGTAAKRMASAMANVEAKLKWEQAQQEKLAAAQGAQGEAIAKMEKNVRGIEMELVDPRWALGNEGRAKLGLNDGEVKRLEEKLASREHQQLISDLSYIAQAYGDLVNLVGGMTKMSFGQRKALALTSVAFSGAVEVAAVSGPIAPYAVAAAVVFKFFETLFSSPDHSGEILQQNFELIHKNMATINENILNLQKSMNASFEQVFRNLGAIYTLQQETLMTIEKNQKLVESTLQNFRLDQMRQNRILRDNLDFTVSLNLATLQELRLDDCAKFRRSFRDYNDRNGGRPFDYQTLAFDNYAERADHFASYGDEWAGCQSTLKDMFDGILNDRPEPLFTVPRENESTTKTGEAAELAVMRSERVRSYDFLKSVFAGCAECVKVFSTHNQSALGNLLVNAKLLDPDSLRIVSQYTLLVEPYFQLENRASDPKHPLLKTSEEIVHDLSAPWSREGQQLLSQNLRVLDLVLGQQILLAGEFISAPLVNIFASAKGAAFENLLAAMGQSESLSANVISAWAERTFDDEDKDLFLNVLYSSRCDAVERIVSQKIPALVVGGECTNETVSGSRQRRIVLQFKDPALPETTLRLRLPLAEQFIAKKTVFARKTQELMSLRREFVQKNLAYKWTEFSPALQNAIRGDEAEAKKETIK